MQDDRSSNVGGQDSGQGAASDGGPERREMTDRERELAAKSLRAREEESESAAGDEPSARHRPPLTSGG